MNSYKKALTLDSTNVRALCNLGNAYYSQGRHQEATGLYRKALRLDPKNQEAIYNMGVAFADAGIYQSAITYWQKVVSIDSLSVVAESAKNSIQVLQEYVDQQKKATQTQSGP
jgi:cytochrome c-type biogenesis protein CcmH/NrfG